MKISSSWLAEWAPTSLSARELGDRLTMAGFELESVAPAAPAFDGVIVAEIVEAVRHPQADKLQVCTVVTGDSPEARAAPLQIVCGAANARAGLRTALAQVGAHLPGELKIKAAKLRGVESAGMLCSAKELGLADTSEGIIEFPVDAPLGISVRDCLALDDEVLELSITPNRGDAMSVRGIAREVAALIGVALTSPDCAAVTPTVIDPALDDRAKATLAAPSACPRFHGRVLIEVDNTRRSPSWLIERLRRSGLRSISPIVDITNYIVLELGQPMHAYDLDKVEGALTVRHAHESERCELLDGRTIDLASDVLVIADEAGPVALAGVMGGQRTAVSPQTSRVLFEVAWFTPSAIAGRGRRYGLTTDASQRFERGVDPEIGAMAIERATALLIQIAGGRAGRVVTAEDRSKVRVPQTVALRIAQIERLLGRAFSERDVTSLLTRLGMSTETAGVGVLKVRPPSSRFDIQIERDLIEEVARLAGYDELPTTIAHARQAILAQPTSVLDEQRPLDLLAARGYHEASISPSSTRHFRPRSSLARRRIRSPIRSRVIWRSCVCRYGRACSKRRSKTNDGNNRECGCSSTAWCFRSESVRKIALPVWRWGHVGPNNGTADVNRRTSSTCEPMSRPCCRSATCRVHSRSMWRRTPRYTRGALLESYETESRPDGSVSFIRVSLESSGSFPHR